MQVARREVDLELGGLAVRREHATLFYSVVKSCPRSLVFQFNYGPLRVIAINCTNIRFSLSISRRGRMSARFRALD